MVTKISSPATSAQHKTDAEVENRDYLANSTQAKARHKVELDAGTVTPFTLSSGQPTGAVRETGYFWYDDARRPTTVAAYGSGNGSSGTNKWQTSALPSYGSAPTASDDYIRVTQYTYNADMGRRETVKNWKTSGTTVVSKTFYDDLGRRKFFVEVWKSGYDPNSSIGNTAGENRTTGWTYTGLGQIERLTAYNNSSSTGHQVTLYQYEDDTNASLVTRTYYPDQVNSGTGNPIGGAKFVEMAYHLDGSPNTQTDQRGVVHTYQYDANRRVELDRVTSFGSSGIVDDTVKSIGRTYDTLGRTTHVTSYSTNNGTGTPLNQLAYMFDTNGMLTETDQEHDGAVDGSTLCVLNGYSEAIDDNDRFINGLRQTSLPLVSRRVIRRGF